MHSQTSEVLSNIEPNALAERGYAIVRGIFDADEVARTRATAMETVAELEQAEQVRTVPGSEGTCRIGTEDLLSISNLRHMLLDRRVLSAVEGLLGGKPVYFGDSSIHIGKNGGRAWHRDNVNRRRWRGGPDWHDPPYPLLRCGIYLQDLTLHSGGLALRPGSNRPGLLRPTLPKLVDAGAGDMVVWDLRTVHSAEVVRLRGLPGLPLHPRMQTWLPDRLRAPDGGERVVMFMTFALSGAHLDYYLAYLKGRKYMRDVWAASRWEPDVRAEAERAGLQILMPKEMDGASPQAPTHEPT